VKSVLSKIDITCHKGLDGTGVLSSMEPQNETSSPLRLYYQSVLDTGIDITGIIQKVGGILTKSKSQHEFLLENLHIYSCKLQETSKKSTKRPCIYTKLAKPFFKHTPY